MGNCWGAYQFLVVTHVTVLVPLLIVIVNRV
jgi:hypothetical protein